MQVNNTNRQNFTGVTQLKIIKDGQVVADEKVKAAAMRAVNKTLRGNDKNGMRTRILNEMVKYDRDFTDQSGVIKNNVTLKRFRNYLLTGKQADDFIAVGEENIKASRRLAYHVQDADAFVDTELQDLTNWVMRAKKKFSKLINELFNPAEPSRIREGFNPVTRAYEGAPVELQIKVKNGKKTSLDIDDFSFEKAGTPPNREHIGQTGQTVASVIPEKKAPTVVEKPKIDANGQYELF